jgi:hypothetical protein
MLIAAINMLGYVFLWAAILASFPIGDTLALVLSCIPAGILESFAAGSALVIATHGPSFLTGLGALLFWGTPTVACFAFAAWLKHRERRLQSR